MILSKSTFECASKGKIARRVNLFKSTPSPGILFIVIVCFFELGSESLNDRFQQMISIRLDIPIHWQ